MRKNIYLAGLLLFATSGFAQVNIQSESLDMKGDVMATNSQRSSRVTNYTDTIWFNSFENSAEWNTVGGGATNGWQISSNTPTWFFQNTSINSTTGGNYAVMVPTDPNSPTLNAASITLGSAIDISAYSNQNLVLTYEKYGARFYDTMYVEVSNDNVSWTTLDDNVDFPLNSTNTSYILPNPSSRDMFIPVNMVNNDSLYVRFRWGATRSGVEGIGYGWFVDDVMLLDVLDNDLVVDQTAFFDDVRLLYSWYYGMMPERQAAADSITFSATYYNRGKNDVTNSGLDLVVSGQDNTTMSSAKVTSTAGILADTARTTVNYSLTNGTGTYTFTWNVVSDSTDQNPGNNTNALDLVVSDNVYSMAPLPVSSANTTGKGGTATAAYTLSQDYFFNATDTIYGIGVAFDTEWSRNGTVFQLSILDNNDVAVVTSDFYTSDATMITDDMIYFPVPETEVVRGGYSARIETFSADSLYVVDCQDPLSPIEPAPNGGFFSRTTLSYGGNNFISDMAYLTIKTNANITCNTNTQVNGNVDDAGEIGAVTLTSVIGLEGPIYTYSWSGPNGFTATTRDLSGLTDQGDYTVTITDVERCTTVETFTVAGKVAVEEVEISGNVSMYPNPNSGNFQLNLEGVTAGEYNIIVRNVVGQTVYQNQIGVNGNYTGEVAISGINSGVYFLELSNNNNERSVIRFVVE